MPEHNMKPREVWCEHCKENTVTDELNPKCANCGASLFTVVKSIMTGKRITGVK